MSDIQLTKIIKTFGPEEAKTYALKGANFSASCGELTMIVGPSGCGKTTLLSIMAGTLNADSGEINVFGHELNKMSSSEITKFRAQHIGFIFQQYNLIPTLNVWENVAIPLLLNGVSLSIAQKKSEEILERVGLKGRGKERPTLLSGGQQQRVAIARGLVHDPKLLICDEPTAALDSETGAQVLKMMKEVGRAKDRCVIIVTHDNRIFKYADKMAEMEDGVVARVHENVYKETAV